MSSNATTREIISNVVLSTGSFEVKVDVTDLSDSKPQRTKVIRAYIDQVVSGYSVKLYATLEHQLIEAKYIGGIAKYIGGIHATYDDAVPSLANAFLEVLAAHEFYADDILAHVDITAKSSGENA